ncbi:helix-turn-helix domain-containing protein [Listeria booriae]|uniref:Helix-turn-helix domain-containing protein n=1 Tax=Listeria booriae TaxID=1552123 RepID=A0A842DLM4_9LIST|nr:helix-turn-helix domain-containing protein [Listeria booriae]MBC2036246.1 helix-turn-helix domain-containing protein [Listeria booriae]MBC6299138.1 helix-turn-helix domain-containing protein [Listeria booriae]
MTVNRQEELLAFLNREFLSRQEAIDYLEVSKQCFHSLVTRGKITKIKKGSAVLYYRYEIESRKQDASGLRKKYRPF